jgi:hypothetical protein
MVNMAFLEFFSDLSDRDIEEECTWNMLSKCFPGLRSEELPSCMRLVGALAVETQEGWLAAGRYLDMELLKKPKKLRLSLAA